MKVTDYIVQFLIQKGITDVFGYPGGSVARLMDSFHQREDAIHAHCVYHEQAAGFAACAYSQITGLPGITYTTGGPGATNLITAIGHAYYDSIPLFCFAGNVNTYEAKGSLPIRQRAFQESDILPVAKPLTKLCLSIKDPQEIRFCLEKLYCIATTGRPGPVLLDLPMDIQKASIEPDTLKPYLSESPSPVCTQEITFQEILQQALVQAKKPCMLLGNGIKIAHATALAKKAIEHLNIPYVTSMIAFDVCGNHANAQGFIGAYGMRAANFIVEKSDLLISIGSRLDIRQTGAIRKNFAPNANILRIDIDANELQYKVHEDEKSFCIDLRLALNRILELKNIPSYEPWKQTCRVLQEKLHSYDDRLPNRYVRSLSQYFPSDAVVTTDVGRNQVWVAQSFCLKENQQVLFSGGMGSMGHALPAAIGAYYGNGHHPTFCICGDGGLQMNLQELQFLAREQIPAKVIVFNNYSLGMIRHFQEMYFQNISFQTTASGGYTAPDFTAIAHAYGLEAIAINGLEDIPSCRDLLLNDRPALIEIRIKEDTYVYPKLEFGKPNCDQQPLLNRKLFQELMALH